MVPATPPATVTAETSRLVFQVSPLSTKGLLSQQVRDALKALGCDLAQGQFFAAPLPGRAFRDWWSTHDN